MADMNLTRSLPAPKTFAPSREDVLSTLAFFFGDPVRRAPCSCTRPRTYSAVRLLR